MRSPSNPGFPPRGLWSLWDMLTLDARQFIILLHKLIQAEQTGRNAKGSLSEKDKANIAEGFKDAIAAMQAMDLPVSLKVADEMLLGAKTYQAANQGIVQLFNTICLELDGRKFYGPLRKFEQYYEQPKLLGDDVFAKFPSANNDIFEAGTCLALERGTACVMHLMRVCEVGLKALAATLSVGIQADWGGYLREIDKALEARVKAAGKRTPDEQFYAEARVTLDGVRIAWRNPTMHIDHNYSPERAEEILAAVGSLMRHLATKISE